MSVFVLPNPDKPELTIEYLHCFCAADMVSGVSVQVSGKVDAIVYPEH